MVFLSVFLIILGLVFCFNPEGVFWFFQEHLIKGGEPTDFVIISNKIGGILMLLLGTVGLF